MLKERLSEDEVGYAYYDSDALYSFLFLFFFFPFFLIFLFFYFNFFSLVWHGKELLTLFIIFLL